MVRIYLQPEVEAMWQDKGAEAPLQPNLRVVEAAWKLLADVQSDERTATQHQAGALAGCH